MSARFLAPSEALLPGDVQLTTTPGFGVGALIRLGTLSMTNHAQVVLDVLPDGRRVVAAAFGDRRGHAVRVDDSTWSGYAVRVSDDEEVRAAVVRAAAALCGASGVAWNAGSTLTEVLSLPGTPYGWDSILLISLRSLRSVSTRRWRITAPLAHWMAERAVFRSSLICSEAVRMAVEAAVGAFDTELPICETSPADLLNLFAGYSHTR